MWKGITEFQKGLLNQLRIPEPAVQVEVASGGPGISLERTKEGWKLLLAKERNLARASLLLEENEGKAVGWRLEEAPTYERLGAMLDCSRNSVPRPETVKKLMGILCRMGYNTLQLYMEDVYPLPEYPYFGYGRGRYTKEELKDLDACAKALGMELIPAIQTLAHLGQSLKWKPMRKLQDCGDILLIGEEETYRLIEAMFSAMRECFSGKRINIGMDEAHMVGLGAYLEKNGYENRMELMLRHFERVHSIAERFGFEPMLWSDMFFRLASGGEYYAPECRMDPKVACSIPKDTTLIYWDYYSEKKETYDRMLEKHDQLCPRVIFAGGAWKWSGPAPCNSFSISLAGKAHASCREHGVREILLTMWGDNGDECSPFAVLPTLQYWAELCWSGCCGEKDEAWEKGLKNRFRLASGGRWEDFLLADQLVFTPDNPAPGRCGVNASKTLLYEDILFPLFSPALDLSAYRAHLRTCAAAMEAAGETEPPVWKPLFSVYGALARLLGRKAEVQEKLRRAWRQKDMAALRELCEKDLPGLKAEAEVYAEAFRRQWLQNSKAAGLDVFDLRIGGQIRRIETAKERLEVYLQGEADTVEELDETWLPFDPEEWKRGRRDIPAPFWHEIASPSNIASI